MTFLGKLWSFFSTTWTYFWATLTAFPFLGFPLAYFLVYLWKKDRRLAGRWAVNITNFLLIRAVVVAYSVIWPEALSAWWWITGFFLAAIGLIGWVQIRLKGKLSLLKASFSVWRLSFLLFGLVYVVLYTTGIFKTMGDV
ncbi:MULTISPECIES: DUF3397 domain-containing protein [Brevibacillus]|uniref:DUF3397 domain-containing protein n=1 Tax=Brevibacillus borstelensis AK1 TaxID=1300222 RepID=M8E5F2_9BACL|nr:DUF3397 domain-containing protein [Brevibacillus borstelensis]EMT54511.1 hypothetical protein I532_02865 [Brevibacillus borstelensis AK1]MCM3471256.1 DUF3397 domain-containing protein [Brevibacillus borstelensis]MCM3589929.1 DUF3397 domain-containing protein [Brevibacillus borstelensis]MCM3622295.1 DUF3397 domain-containing protein [Brevibacillus borstelensis]MED1745869.1 DUF3397 domain-containing protein [Brevibacillus borstelensis]